MDMKFLFTLYNMLGYWFSTLASILFVTLG